MLQSVEGLDQMRVSAVKDDLKTQAGGISDATLTNTAANAPKKSSTRAEKARRQAAGGKY